MTVPFRGDPLVAVWEGFVPNPGYDFLGSEHWARWNEYAAAVVRTVAEQPALLLLELMNEPFVTHIGQDVDRRADHGVPRARARPGPQAGTRAADLDRRSEPGVVRGA